MKELIIISAVIIFNAPLSNSKIITFYIGICNKISKYSPAPCSLSVHHGAGQNPEREPSKKPMHFLD